jgi:hypothetical protein
LKALLVLDVAGSPPNIDGRRVLPPKSEPVFDAVLAGPGAVLPKSEPVFDAVLAGAGAVLPKSEPVFDAVLAGAGAVLPKSEPVLDAVLGSAGAVLPKSEPVLAAGWVGARLGVGVGGAAVNVEGVDASGDADKPTDAADPAQARRTGDR